MTGKRRLLAVLVLAGLAACGSTPETDVPAGGTTLRVNLDDRPFRLHVPRSSSAGAKMPLVVALHGYSSSAAGIESYFKLTAESERLGFLYAMPDGPRTLKENDSGTRPTRAATSTGPVWTIPGTCTGCWTRSSRRTRWTPRAST